MEPKVYRDPQRKRTLWLGVIVAVIILGGIVLAILSMDSTVRSAGAFTGKIIAKEFTPAPAQEITLGRGGLQSTHVEGEFLLKVQTPDGSRVYNVWVDKTVYDNFKVGDDYYVVPTP